LLCDQVTVSVDVVNRNHNIVIKVLGVWGKQ
jgi:hypothetical protein